MIVTAPMAVGDLLDKISILGIKCDVLRGVDAGAYDKVLNEYMLLFEVARMAAIPLDGEDFADLRAVNWKLWQAEERIRSIDPRNLTALAATARAIVTWNDHRAALKRTINTAYDSTIVEVKAYGGGVQ